MNYPRFRNKNKRNKDSYEIMKKDAPTSAGVLFYSWKISKVDMDKGDCVLTNNHPSRPYQHQKTDIATLVDLIAKDDMLHITNPSRIKDWRGFVDFD